jgi:hypothetical protein
MYSKRVFLRHYDNHHGVRDGQVAEVLGPDGHHTIVFDVYPASISRVQAVASRQRLEV